MIDADTESNCPACKKSTNHFIDWEFSGLNDSIFNYIAQFYECQNCGLVYIKNIDDEKLAEFYQDECPYSEKDHFDVLNSANIEKYKNYREFIDKAGLLNYAVTDVGCGRGGFIRWLTDHQWSGSCVGVDIDIKSIPSIQKKNLSFKNGCAVSLPFSDKSQFLLTYFHVLEHISDINRVLKEAFRVLDDCGYILIEVPDAERYINHPVGTAFWPSIREHIYHFSPQSLYYALNNNRFNVVSTFRSLLPTPEFFYPSLMILAQKDINLQKRPFLEKESDVGDFFKQSKILLKLQADQIKSCCSELQSITFWGCSSELFSLLPLLNLSKFSLCDANKNKQNSLYKGITIADPANIDKQGMLVIAPYLYGEVIEKSAINLGWNNSAILRLK